MHVTLTKFARALTAYVAIVMLPLALRAQDVHGIIRDSATRAPIAGAVVELLDANGGMVRRTISNERGQYRVLAPPTGQQLRVRRMGFRPRSVNLPRITASTERDITMVSVPTLLQTVSVADQPQCPKRSDRAQALALWEQARAGLLSTVVAREANPGFMRRLAYHRVVNENRPMVLSQIVHIDSATADRPFAAPRSADEFIQYGFVSEQGATRVFDGPDADVLLDDAFVHGYCFRIAKPDAARPTLIGLAFEAAQTQTGRVDITGTLWVDSVTRTLSDLTFRYQGLQRAEEALGAGGSLSFRTMPNGLPVIDQWSLLLAAPRNARDPKAVAPTPLARRQNDSRELLELYEIGGELASARWGDSTQWQASLGTVRGRLLLHGEPIPHTPLRLVGTDYRTTSDGDGRFEITELLPGRYVFSLPDSALNAVGFELTRGQSFTVQRGATTIADMTVPTDSSLIAAKCDGGRAPGMLIVAGRVMTSAGRPAPNASVTLLRDEGHSSARLNGKSTKALVWKGESGASAAFYSVFDGEAGSNGKFWICGIAPYSHYVIDAKGDGERGMNLFVTSSLLKRRYTTAVTLDPPLH